MALAVVLGAFMLRAKDVNRSYEIFQDEIIYFLISENVATKLRVELHEEGFYLHPPAFFFIEAAYIAFLDLGRDLIQDVYATRYLNIILAALSSLLMFSVAYWAGGLAAGVMAGLIFSLDPFAIKMNSRNMLDSPAMFWVLMGLATTGSLVPKRSCHYLLKIIASGLAFGIAMMTKDMMAFLTLLPLGICFIFGSPISRMTAVSIGAITAFTYSAYPLAIALSGDWQRFAEKKLHGVARFVGLVQETGFKREGGGPSFLEAVTANLSQFGTAYVLIGLGILAAGALFTLGGARQRLIAIWTVSAYGLLGYSIGFGTLEEQFFYFLVVPAMLAVAVAGALVLTPGVLSRPFWSAGVLGATVLGVTFVLWSSYVWVTVHSTPDNGYEHLAAYMRQHVPRGSRVAVTTISATFLLRGYSISSAASVQELQASGADYVLISTRQIRARGSPASSELIEWTQSHGEAVFQFEGPSHGRLALYRLPAQI